MAGNAAYHTPSFMTTPGRLRVVSAAEEFKTGVAKALFEKGLDGVIDRRRMVSDPHARPPTRQGLVHGLKGMLRVFGIPTGSALPNLAVYALFEGDEALSAAPVRLAEYEPPDEATKDSHGAAVLELRDVPGDCRLVVLSSAPAVICYSHTV